MTSHSTLAAVARIFLKLLPVLAFVLPLVMLYLQFPDSFEATWKGRSYYLIFIWLASMEVALNWKTISKITNLKSLRVFALAIASVMPTVYVTYIENSGLYRAIADLAQSSNIPLYTYVPLSVEYVALVALFGLVVALLYGGGGLKDYILPIALLTAIATIYTIDDYVPYGGFTPLQILVPPTSNLASGLLNILGYQTHYVGTYEGMYVLQASNTTGTASFAIAWPCAGIEGLLLYTLTILLFLQSSAIPTRHKIVYFLVGAVVTYTINVLRIAEIFILGVNNGDWTFFHDYTAQMITVTWIVSYLLLITTTQLLQQRMLPPPSSRSATMLRKE
jgi:thaumarchaeosortase